jgi:hypothetical protein
MRKVSLISHQIPFLAARRLGKDLKFEPKTFTFFSCILEEINPPKVEHFASYFILLIWHGGLFVCDP